MLLFVWIYLFKCLVSHNWAIKLFSVVLSFQESLTFPLLYGYVITPYPSEEFSFLTWSTPCHTGFSFSHASFFWFILIVGIDVCQYQCMGNNTERFSSGIILVPMYWFHSFHKPLIRNSRVWNILALLISLCSVLLIHWPLYRNSFCSKAWLTKEQKPLQLIDNNAVWLRCWSLGIRFSKHYTVIAVDFPLVD